MVSLFALSACNRADRSAADRRETFMCPPCGCAVDHVEFDSPGPCPDCGMPLAPTYESDLGYRPDKLAKRAGSFELSGGVGHEQDRVKVHYYLPDNFTAKSDILLVVPGAGRNSADYRNAWLGVAREKNILIAALGYPETDYDFADYHLAGLVKNLEYRARPSESEADGTRIIRVDDDDIDFDVNANADQWLFSDFDRVFAHLVSITASQQVNYDIFGHSAGGQILHRFALLQENSRARRIVSANSGFYSLPTLQTPPITGLAGLGVQSDAIVRALDRPLTLLLGELDNGDTAGGTMLHTPLVDEQGLGRLARGRTFYAAGQEQAKQLSVPFSWELKTVPGVGHNYEAMSRAAANLLYY